MMIQRGRRQADRFHGDLYVVYVEQDALNAEDQRVHRRNLADARAARAHVEILHGEDPIGLILQLRRRARHHADFRRPQPAARIPEPLETESGGAPHHGSRRHRRADFPSHANSRRTQPR